MVLKLVLLLIKPISLVLTFPLTVFSAIPMLLILPLNSSITLCHPSLSL